MSQSNIQLRAARYFGMEDHPRTSIKVGRYKVLLITRRGGALVMATYSEEGAEPRGAYLYMNGGQDQRIVDAIKLSYLDKGDSQ